MRRKRLSGVLHAAWRTLRKREATGPPGREATDVRQRGSEEEIEGDASDSVAKGLVRTLRLGKNGWSVNVNAVASVSKIGKVDVVQEPLP